MRCDLSILGGMATYNNARRLRTLPRVIESLIHQVSLLHVYWNGPGIMPPWFSDYFPCIQVHDGPDIGVLGKFVGFVDHKGFCLGLDDDYIYPPHYVEHIIRGVESYDRQAIVGYHGARLEYWPIKQSYYRERTVFHNQHALDVDTRVHTLGTGMMAWHTDTLSGSTIRDTPRRSEGYRMADLWFGRLAQSLHIPLVCLRHAPRVAESLPQDDTIFAKAWANDTIQTAYVNMHPWIFPSFLSRSL